MDLLKFSLRLGTSIYDPLITFCFFLLFIVFFYYDSGDIGDATEPPL